MTIAKCASRSTVLTSTIVLLGILSSSNNFAAEQFLGRVAHISDSQIVDEESPARAIRVDKTFSSAWRPQEAFGLQTLNSLIRTINRTHRERPIDFLVFTGDIADSSQWNELRWVIDTMDGLTVTPDSGELDGTRSPLPADINPNLPFHAHGLHHDIPWYTVYGNHDGLAVGNFAIDFNSQAEKSFAPLFLPVAAILGFLKIDPFYSKMLPTDDRSPAILLASEDKIDYERMVLNLKSVIHGPIPSDPGRRFIDRKGFIEEHFQSRTQPLGHGFSASHRQSGEVYYSIRPKKEFPLRLLVLDTVSNKNLSMFSSFCGVMTRQQFERFIKPEVEKAKKNGEFVVLASHHPTSDFEGNFLCAAKSDVRQKEFRDYLSSQAHVLAHLVGHGHKQRAELVTGQSAYMEIQTASIIDFPQEGRLLEFFFDREDNSARIESSILSHADVNLDDTLAQESFRRSVRDCRNFTLRSLAPTTLSMELFNDLGKGMRTHADPQDGVEIESCEDAYGTPLDRRFSVKLLGKRTGI